MKNLKLVAILPSFLFTSIKINAEETKSNELSADELRFIAQSMKMVEDSLFNVRIDSNAWLEQGPSPSGPWERTPVCWSTTAFLGNISSNRSRIDFHKNVARWENGAAPYLDENFSVSYNGVQGRRKKISSSYNGNTFNTKTGEILSEEPVQLTGCGRITGIEASVFFYYRNMPSPFPKRFSANFEAAADPNSFLSALAVADPKYLNAKPLKHKVVFEELGGIQCIKAACMSGSLLQEWWLDPNRGFALLRSEKLRKDTDGNWQIKSSINVTKLKEVTKNIWWPMEVCFVEPPLEAGQPWERIVYQASNVVANAPNFDESVFTISFPRGYRIDDQVNKKSYIIDPNLSMIPEPNYSPHFKTIRKSDDR